MGTDADADADADTDADADAADTYLPQSLFCIYHFIICVLNIYVHIDILDNSDSKIISGIRRTKNVKINSLYLI